jgi:hypothetical protein
LPTSYKFAEHHVPYRMRDVNYSALLELERQVQTMQTGSENT